MKDGPEPAGEMPIRLMLGALVAAAAIGVIAPVSDYERRRAIPARSELTGRARRALNKLLDHAKNVLQETFAAGGESAKHGQQLATDVRQEFGVASDRSAAQQPNSPDV